MDFAKKVLAAIWPEWEIVGDAEIGKGSYGKVYKIKREYIGNREQFAALKVIRFPDTTDREHINEMVEEIELMTTLKGHTNIVSYEDHKVIEYEEDSGCTILLRMELLTPFSEYIKTKELNKREIVRLGIDICKALEVCQKKKIIHRDIKPQNIFVSEDGDFKLGDFGSARSLDMTQDVMTIAGSWPYMAPEVVKFEPYGKKADIYSLGTVLYELLNNGCKPHYPSQRPTAKEAEAALQKKLTGEKLSAPCNSDSILSGIVMKACEFDSKKRFSSATEMKEELEKWLYKKPKKAFWERVKEKTKEVLSKINRKKLKTILKILVCIVLVAAIITGGIFIYNAVPKNDWREAYETELQKLLNQNISFSSVFVGEINNGEAPVVAVSTIDGDTYPIPQYVFSYKDGKVRTLGRMDSDTGGAVKEDVLFIKGTNLVVFRSLGNSEGTKGSAQQIIYGIENDEYVELENAEDFGWQYYSSIEEAQKDLTEKMDDILFNYTDYIEFVSFNDNMVEENTIDYLNEKLDIELSEDIVFKAYEAYEEKVGYVYSINRENPIANFAVVELTGDNIPELIIENNFGKTESNGLEFFSYDTNGIIDIGSEYYGWIDCMYDDVQGDGKVYVVYGHQADRQFEIVDNRLINTPVKENNDAIDDEIGREYKNEIRLYSIADRRAYFDMLYENRTSYNLTGVESKTTIEDAYMQETNMPESTIIIEPANLSQTYSNHIFEQSQTITITKESTINSNVVGSGTCGENVTWAFYDDGELVINGSGDMTDWTFVSHPPWYDYRTNVLRLTIDDGVKSVGNHAFFNCFFEEIFIPNSVMCIGENAFSSCATLKKVVFESNSKLKVIEDAAFYDCYNLESINLEVCSNLLSIEDSAFMQCKSIKSIIIPNGVVKIGRLAFDFCYSLEKITIPNSVKSIGGSMFYLCDNLTDIFYEGTKEQWDEIIIYDENDEWKSKITIHYNA